MKDFKEAGFENKKKIMNIGKNENNENSKPAMYQILHYYFPNVFAGSYTAGFSVPRTHSVIDTYLRECPFLFSLGISLRVIMASRP